MNLRLIIAFLSTSLLIVGCSEEVRKNFDPRPVAFGPLNQLVVVADQALWESAVGDTFDYYFAAPYPILPQPEPIYDIKHYTPEQLFSLKERKELRTYIFLSDVKSNSSRTTKLIRDDLGVEKVNATLEGDGFKTSVAKDKWADGQTLIYMMGAGPEKIIENIQRSFGAVIKRIREADKRKLGAGIYLEGTNNELEAEIKGKMGVSLKLPAGYVLAMHDEPNNVMWLRYETDEASSNIMLKKMPYEDQEQFSKLGLKSVRDTLGQYVSTRVPNTFMIINDIDLPMLLETMNLNNYYTVEARGIWEIENDYMGGPFVSYMMRNANTNELLFLDGFIHAPGEEKRRYMQELEHVLHSVQF